MGSVATKEKKSASERTPGQLATDEVGERIFEASLRGERLLPNGCMLIPSDTDWAANSVERCRREGQTVVLCFPGGSTQVIRPAPHRALRFRFLRWFARHWHKGPYAACYPR